MTASHCLQAPRRVVRIVRADRGNRSLFPRQTADLVRERILAPAICLVVALFAGGLVPSAAADTAPSSTIAEEQHWRATQQAFRDVAERLRPYLVRIETVGGSQPQGFIPATDEEGEEGEKREIPKPFQDDLGSGFIVADGPTTGIIYSADGHIITSSFNFVRDPVLISVVLPDDRRFAAELIARDQVRKIALLKIEATGLPVPDWCDLGDIHVGQWAVALGLGFGGDRPAISTGILSAVNRMQGNAVQTDAKLSPANYGGPVCNLQGRIIGIAVPMAQRPGELAGIEMYDSGVGFAVPKHRVDEIVSSLKSGQSFYRGWLGISIDPRSVDSVLIRNVADPSPMKEAGVKPGDKIISANGRRLHNFGHLVQALYMLPAGDRVYLHMQRGDREFGVAVALVRNTELGPLPKLEEPPDPSIPQTPEPPPDESPP